MLTKSCVRFFSPSRAALSPILRDEYLTSAIRTKKGEKPGSNQPPARNLVHFKLELAPNYLLLTSKIPAPDPLDMSPCLRRVRARSFHNFSMKTILKMQDQLSQHDRCKILDQRHLRYACIKLERFLRDILFQTIPLRAVVISVMFNCSNGLQ